MQKIVLIIALGFMLAMGGCRNCGSQDLGDRVFSLELGEYQKIASLSKKSKLNISIPLRIIPHPEADKDMKFKISSISFVKGSGKLLGRADEEVGVGYEINPGENMFTYQPEKLGENNIRIEVSDEWDETKQSAMVSLQVEEKKVPIEMQLTKVIEKEWLFPYQEGKLRLELSAKSVEASKLEHRIKSLKIEKGNLFTNGRDELKEGDKIELGEHDLVFIPKGEGRAKIEIEIENEESTTKSGSVSFEIKPVLFDLSSSLNIVEEGTWEQAEVSITIPATGNDLDKEVFKVVGVEFSDGLTRKLLSAEGDDLIGSKLRPGSKYTFSWPVQKVEDGVKMKIKLEGAGGVYEKEINFSNMMKQALVKKGKEALEATKRSRTKAQDILAMKVEEKSYEKVVSGESEVKKDLADIVAKIARLESNGLDRSGLEALKREEKELRSQVEKAQEHSKKISKKKFAFEAEIVAPKRNIFSYQEAEVELGISSTEKENKTAVYTIKQLSPTKGKLRFADGSEVKEGSKVGFGRRKLVFEPSREAEKENIEIVLESDKGTSSKAEIELTVKPVEFKLEGAFELVDLAKGELKVCIPATGNDLDKENFGIVYLEFSDGVTRPLTAKGIVERKPGNEWQFSMDSQKIAKGVKLKAKIEGAGGVYDKEIDFERLYNEALVLKQGEIAKEMIILASKGDDLLFKKGVEYYEAVVKDEEKLRKDLTELASKIKKLEAIGLEGTPLQSLKEALSEVEDKLGQVQDLLKELAKKKFAFKINMQVERQETFAHIPVALRLSLSSDEPLARRISYQIKDIVVTKGKVHGERGGEVRVGNKVDFGDNSLKFIPSGEMDKAKIKIMIENEKGAEEIIKKSIQVKPVDFTINVGGMSVIERGREGYGKLEVSIETDKLLEKETFKVTGVRFGDKYTPIAEKISEINIEEFKKQMAVLVAGGREEENIKDDIKKLRDKNGDIDDAQTKSTKLLTSFQSSAQRYQKQLTAANEKGKTIEYRIANKMEKEGYGSGTLTIATKNKDLGQIWDLNKQREGSSKQMNLYNEAAYTLQQQQEGNKKIFERAKRQIDEEMKMLKGKEKVWEDLKLVRGEKEAAELIPELFNASMGKEDYALSTDKNSKTTLFLKLSRANMPSKLVLTVEGPGKVKKDVTVDIRAVVEGRVASKIEEVTKNLTGLGNEMEWKLREEMNGGKYKELKSYMDGLEIQIAGALKPLRDSFGEDWWTNTRFMEANNAKDLVKVVAGVTDKLKKLDQKKANLEGRINSFKLKFSFESPKVTSSEEYLDMKLELKDVDPLMKGKVWKAIGWEYVSPNGGEVSLDKEKAVVITDEKGKVLSEVILTGEKRKLRLKLPKANYGENPQLKVKVVALDGEELVVQRDITEDLGIWIKVLFEADMSQFVEKVKDANSRMEACLKGLSSGNRFDTIVRLKAEADGLEQEHDLKVKKLAAKGIDIKRSADVQKLSDGMRLKAFEYATKDLPSLIKNKEELDKLIKVGAEVIGTVEELDKVDTPDPVDGNLAIHKWAADSKISAESFEAVVKSTPKDKINAKNKAELTPLQVLMSNSEVYSNPQIGKQLLEILLKAGADVNARDEDGDTPLHMAAYGDNIELVPLLLAYGADKNAKDKCDWTPLHAAAKEGRSVAVDLLIKSGADKNAKDKNGKTPLEVAFDLERSEIVRILLRSGASTSVHGLPILIGAVYDSSADMVQAVIDSGAVGVNSSIGSRTFFGVEGKQWSPLHVAALRGDKGIARMLLRAGADKNREYDFWYKGEKRSYWNNLNPSHLASYRKDNGMSELICR